LLERYRLSKLVSPSNAPTSMVAMSLPFRYISVTVVGFHVLMSEGMVVSPRLRQSIVVPEQEHTDGHPASVVVVVTVVFVVAVAVSVVGFSVVVTQVAIGN